MKKKFAILLAFIIIVSTISPITSFAQETTIRVTAKDMKTKSGQAIEDALKQAKKIATVKKPVTVEVASGRYNLERCLHIYSNITLKLQEDTYFTKTFSEGNMIKAGKQEEVNNGYDGYTNFNIIGGVWDGALNGNSCAMRFAHCSDVTIQNVTIKNVKNSHHMEFAASKDFKVINCNFSGYSRTNSGDGEAIQIDILHNATHFPSYRVFDDTPCKNITVKGCNFENVYAGVGTRSGVTGSYFNNINITDNTFTNVKDKAICAFNYRNSTIKNNTINSSTIGIIFEYYPAPNSNLWSKLYMPNSKSASTKLINDSKCIISDNLINVKNNTGRSNSSGIAVYGGYLSSKAANSYGLKAGNYSVNNLTISNNKISSKSKSTSGILLNYVNYSDIISNSVINKGGVNKSVNGIRLINSSNNNIKGNNVKSFFNGVSLSASSKSNSFSLNTLNKNKRYGVNVGKKSTAIIIYGNKMKKNKKGSLRIYKKSCILMNFNTNLTAKKAKNKNSLSWTRIKYATGYRIYRSNKKDSDFKLITIIKNNKITTYTDTSVNANNSYYYKIEPFKSFRKTKILGKNSNVA